MEIMTKKALLITGQESQTVSTLARNLIHGGGLSIFARQMKQLAAIGVEEIHLVTDWFAQDFEKEVLNCTARPDKIFIHSTKNAPLKLLEHNNDGNVWFLLEEGVLLDDRLIEQVANHTSPTLITLIGHNEFLEERTANGIFLHLEACEGYFGSIAKLSSKTLSANIRKLNSIEGLPNALKAIARAGDCEILKLIDIPLYVEKYGRTIDLIWLPLVRREEGDLGTQVLSEYAQNSAQDYVARYIYHFAERQLVKYICKSPVSPIHVITLSSLMGFYVMYLFWAGNIFPALFGSYMVSILYAMNDKFIHVKRVPLKFERLAHLLAKIIEYGWYLAFATYLSTQYGSAASIMAITLILFNIADEGQLEFYRRMAGHRLYYSAQFDRRFQLIAGRRNTLMWALLPFVLYDQWYLGLGVLCAYAIVTFFVHQVRVVYHLKNLMIENSSLFAANFKNTKIL